MVCNPLTPDAYKVVVRAPLVSPYAYRWILANNDREAASMGSLVEYLHAAQTMPRSLNGAVIHSGNNRIGQNPPYGKLHHVSIAVDGEIMVDAADPEPEPPEIQNANQSSLLKARITLAMGTARERTFDFDIAAGVEFDVMAYAIQKIEVLIPDSRILPVPNAPEPLPLGTVLGPQQLATILTTTTYFTAKVPKGSPFPLTYTVPYAGSEFFIPRTANAQLVQAMSDDTGEDVTLQFIYVPEGLPEAGFASPTAYFVVGEVLVPDGTVTNRIVIPGNANAFRMVTPGGGAATGNLIQILGGT